jgi:hypothetical protein
VACRCAGGLARAPHAGHPRFSLLVEDASETVSDADPLQEQAARLFVEQLAANRIPSVRAIRAQLHIGQPRAQRLLGDRGRLARSRSAPRTNVCMERVIAGGHLVVAMHARAWLDQDLLSVERVLAAARVPSIRTIRAQLHVGKPRAQRLRDYLAAGQES